MQKNSMEALSESLALKRQQDQEKIQELSLRELKKLVRSLRDGLSGELDTTRSVTKGEIDKITALIEKLTTETLKASSSTKTKLKNDLTEIERASSRNRAAALSSLKWGWLKYSLPALMVLLTILAASWGLMRYLSLELLETGQEIRSAQQTLKQLPAEVQFLERSGNQYLLLEKEPDLYQAESGSWVVKLNKR